jgi:hypothetical protein
MPGFTNGYSTIAEPGAPASVRPGSPIPPIAEPEPVLTPHPDACRFCGVMFRLPAARRGHEDYCELRTVEANA